MSLSIGPNATPAPAATQATQGNESLESLMGQRLMMNFQQHQQATSKAMTKMTDQIKASMQDEE